MKKILAMSSMLVVANAALAASLTESWTNTGVRDNPADITYPTDGPRTGTVINIPVAGTASWDALGSPNNVVMNFDAAAALGLPSGTPVVMNGIGWDVTIEALGASWQSEIAVYFDDNVAPDGTGLHLRPGVSAQNPGVGSYNSGGLIKFGPGTPNPGIATINLPNGILRMEFYETFDDGAGSQDGAWLSGNLMVQLVPEPASLSLLALGALALIRRR